MNKRIFLVVLLPLVILACVSKTDKNNSELLENQFIETETPTLIPTRIPLSELSIEEILIKDGDLPAGFSGAQIRDIAPQMFDGVPEAQNIIYQQIAKKDELRGGVTVFLYESESDLATTYKMILSGLSKNASSIEIGEKGHLIYYSREILGIKDQFGDLLFARCNAIVHIRMLDIPNEDNLIAYAKRLDKRLIEIVCE